MMTPTRMDPWGLRSRESAEALEAEWIRVMAQAIPDATHIFFDHAPAGSQLHLVFPLSGRLARAVWSIHALPKQADFGAPPDPVGEMARIIQGDVGYLIRTAGLVEFSMAPYATMATWAAAMFQGHPFSAYERTGPVFNRVGGLGVDPDPV